VADFSARHSNESENDIVWNQRWILAFAVEVRKKGENPDPSLSKRIFIKGTRELWKKTRQKNVL
jgi:hypothetical protein